MARKTILLLNSHAKFGHCSRGRSNSVQDHSAPRVPFYVDDLINEKGLIVESLLFLLFFILCTASVFYLVTRKLDQSISTQQSLYDQERGSFHTELQILEFTAAGLPVLRPETEVIEVLKSAQLISSLHSVVKLPFCAAVVHANLNPITNVLEITTVPNNQINCEELNGVVPSCVEKKLQQLLNANNKNQQYFIMGFYVEKGEPFADQCALARAAAHEVLPPLMVQPSYFESPTLSPTLTPTVLPSETPTVSPYVSLSPSPSVTIIPTPSSNPSSEPSYNPTPEPSLVASQEPTTIPTTVPTVQASPVQSPVFTPVPSVMLSPQPTLPATLQPSAIPTSIPSLNPSIVSTPFSTPQVSQIPQPTFFPSSFPSPELSAFPSLPDSPVLRLNASSPSELLN